jgi:hypothetical protein
LRTLTRVITTYAVVKKSTFVTTLLVLLVKVTPQALERHLNVSALQRPVLLLEGSTPQGLELHLDVSAQQRLVLLLKVSTPQGPSCI